MSLIRKGRYYWLDCRIRNKRYRRSLHTTHRTIALARYGEKLEELQAEFRNERTCLIDFKKKYIEWAWTSKPASALREQQRLYKIVQFLVEVCRIVYLDEITPYHIEQLKAWLRKEKRSHKAIKSPKTVNMYLQTFRCMLYRAIDWELYDKPNPMKKVRFLKHENPVRGLSDKDLAKVLDEAKRISENPRSRLQALFYDLCVFALNTGMRRSEVLNLTWKDVKGDTAEIIGKGRKRRIVPLNETSRNILRKYLTKTEYVFDLDNRNLPTLFTKTTERIKRETGIDFHFHLLRHSFTTALVERGVDFITIGSILGHSKTTMSMLYSHTSEEKKKKAVELLDTLSDTVKGNSSITP